MSPFITYAAFRHFSPMLSTASNNDRDKQFVIKYLNETMFLDRKVIDLKERSDTANFDIIFEKAPNKLETIIQRRR